MEIITGKAFKLDNTCVTIGKFDGLHIGHQLLLTEMEKYRGIYTTVMINFEFSQFEKTLNRGPEAIKLYTEEQKIDCLNRRGPEVLIQYPFDIETSQITAYDFLKNVLAGQLGVKVIVAGSNFRFGKGAAGDVRFLTEHEREFGYVTDIIECAERDGKIISSSRIREALKTGNNADAELFLNKKYW